MDVLGLKLTLEFEGEENVECLIWLQHRFCSEGDRICFDTVAKGTGFAFVL
jgi:hypothetical protein